MKDTSVKLRLAEKQLDHWKDAAGSEGLSLSDWIRQCCEDRLRENTEDSYETKRPGAGVKEEVSVPPVPPTPTR